MAAGPGTTGLRQRTRSRLPLPVLPGRADQSSPATGAAGRRRDTGSAVAARTDQERGIATVAAGTAGARTAAGSAGPAVATVTAVAE